MKNGKIISFYFILKYTFYKETRITIHFIDNTIYTYQAIFINSVQFMIINKITTINIFLDFEHYDNKKKMYLFTYAQHTY